MLREKNIQAPLANRVSAAKWAASAGRKRSEDGQPKGTPGISRLHELVSSGVGPAIVARTDAVLDQEGAHRGSRLLRSLSSADLRRIEPDLTIRTFDADELIHSGGDIIRDILFPHNMTISLIGLTADGVAVESICVGSEGFVGVESMLGCAAATCSAVARRGQASSIKLDRLLILMDQLPALRAVLLRYATGYLAGLSRLAGCNAVHTLRQRACRRLLLEVDQTGRQAAAITQEGLARALGVRRTSANQACRELRCDGVIDYSRGQIRIKDAARMKEAACECYAYLRHILPV